MRRTILILISLLCILLINSCTSENFSSNETSTSETQTVTDTQADTSEPAAEETVEEKKGDVQQVVPATEEDLNQPRAGEAGPKEITLTIIDKDGNRRDETVNTEAGDLLSALESSGLGSASEGYITTVGGITANLDNFEWWEITKDGQPISTKAEQTPINNGESYVFTLKSPE